MVLLGSWNDRLSGDKVGIPGDISDGTGVPLCSYSLGHCRGTTSSDAQLLQ